MKYIAVCFFLCLTSLVCNAESFGYKSVELLYDSKSVDECKFLGDMIGSKANVSLSSHEGEAIVLGLLNGWRHEAYLSGANVLNIERVYLQEGQEYTPEMNGFYRTSSHDQNRVILYPKAYICAK